MARPISPTPKLKGEDAKALLTQLEKTAPPQVIAERQAQAEARLARVLASGETRGTDAGAKRR
jgi:hypothetical protein